MTSLWLSALQNDTAFWFSSLVYGLYARIRFLIHKILNANKMLLTVKNFIISRITLNKITIFWPIQMKYSTCVSLFIELNENDVKKSCLLWASFFFFNSRWFLRTRWWVKGDIHWSSFRGILISRIWFS